MAISPKQVQATSGSGKTKVQVKKKLTTKLAAPHIAAIDRASELSIEIANLKAKVKPLETELKKCLAVVDGELANTPAEEEGTMQGLSAAADYGAKKNQSTVDSAQITKDLVEGEQWDLLGSLANYTIADLKSYVENWEEYVTSARTGNRTVTIRSTVE